MSYGGHKKMSLGIISGRFLKILERDNGIHLALQRYLFGWFENHEGQGIPDQINQPKH